VGNGAWVRSSFRGLWACSRAWKCEGETRVWLEGFLARARGSDCKSHAAYAGRSAPFLVKGVFHQGRPWPWDWLPAAGGRCRQAAVSAAAAGRLDGASSLKPGRSDDALRRTAAACCANACCANARSTREWQRRPFCCSGPSPSYFLQALACPGLACTPVTLHLPSTSHIYTFTMRPAGAPFR
jgi:hypothetical protein